jgi:hypothetical protein
VEGRMPGIKIREIPPFTSSAIAPALLYYRTSMCISRRKVVRNAG